jgi:Tol biopolymer transport system component
MRKQTALFPRTTIWAVAGALALVLGVLTLPAQAAPGPSTERTSIEAGTGAAELPAMTPDGSRVAMVGRGESNAGVWLVDRDAGQTYRISSGMHFNPAISADGDTLAYVEYGSNRSVWVVDITDPASPGSRELASRSTSGQAANGLSDFPALSADGRLVAFQSTASNLDPSVPLPPSGGPNKVYLRDRVAGTTEMVSVDNSGAAQPGNAIKPSLSADGREVAFASEADLAGPVLGVLAAGEEEEPTTVPQVWVRDRQAATTEPVSVSSDGVPGDAGSALVYGPTISADGREVAFESDATNLVPADTNGRTDAFLHDRLTDGTTRVSERTPFEQFGGFSPVTPVRLLDTRDSGTPVGPGQTVEVQVTGGAVPANAVGAALNITATQPTQSTHLTVYPTGEPQPLASILNVGPGETRANAATVKIGDDGKVTIFNSQGSTHVVVDLAGWYDDASIAAGGGFISTQPTRILDTRTGTGVKVGPKETVDVQVTGVAGVPDDATAVAFNLTATDVVNGGFVTAHPTGQALPLASNLNVAPGETKPNTVVVKVGDGGMVSIYNDTSELHLVADLQGWFDADLPEGGFAGLTPSRLLDTRDAGIPVGPGQTIDLAVLGKGGVPSDGVVTVALNVTVTDTTAPGYLTVFPTGVPRPLASNQNFVPGTTAPNEVLAQVGADGKISFFNSAGTTHVVVDVMGWFSGTQVSEGGSGPAVSADGDHVAFESLSSTLTPGDVNGVVDAFVRDRSPALTERVSVVDETAGGTEATGTRIDGNTGLEVPQKNGADVTVGAAGNVISFTSNGNLANDRTVGEEGGEELSTEPAVFTRTRS